MAVYPVNIEMSGRRCLLVGGGAVAFRKLITLLAADAEVVIVSPRLCQSMALMVEAQGINWQKRTYRAGDLAERFMVFAATDDHDVQNQIRQDAKKASVLINCADKPEACDFQLPARLSYHELLITISTNGASPAFATRVRDRIEQVIGPEYGAVASLMKLVRKEIIDQQEDADQNKAVFYQILELNLESLIRLKRWQEMAEKLKAILPYHVDISELVNTVRAEYLSSTSNLNQR